MILLSLKYIIIVPICWKVLSDLPKLHRWWEEVYQEVYPGHAYIKYFPTNHSEEDIIAFILVIIVEAEAQRAWRKLPKPSKYISCEALIWSQAF